VSHPHGLDADGNVIFPATKARLPSLTVAELTNQLLDLPGDLIVYIEGDGWYPATDCKQEQLGNHHFVEIS
jgi:hypothetical protein